MNTSSRKVILVTLILVAAVGAGVYQQQKISAAQQLIHSAREQFAGVTNRIVVAGEELESIQSQLRMQRHTREQATASIAEMERELATIEPESRWVDVPRNLPDWNSESPYVWVSKEIVAKVSWPAFSDDGAVEDAVASVLGIDDAQLEKLNAVLRETLSDYRKLEAANVKLTDEHLPGIGKDGEVITITWEPPAEGAALKSQFEGALRQALGDQRANLLLQVDRDMGDCFGQPDPKSEASKISLIRHRKGGMNISVRAPNNWISVGVSKGSEDEITRHIPPHLQSFFADLFKPME